MKAMTIMEFGKPSVFQLMELPKPVLEPNQVLIKVTASSVNPIDTKIRSGLVPAATSPFPAVLNVDVAGEIVEIGGNVSGFKVGDRIVAMGGGVKGHDGALAEFMRINQAFMTKIPESITDEKAAVMPVVGLTAWEALITRANIRSGQKILIHGGAGGVGHIALQIAVSMGAEVTVTVSNTEKAAIANRLGAQHIVNYNTQSVKDYVDEITGGSGYDVIFDTVGGQNLNNSFEAAAVNGIIVTTNARSTNDLSLMHAKGLTLHVVFLLVPLLYGKNKDTVGENLNKIMKMMDDEKINPVIYDRSFGFSQVKEAHELLEKGGHVGKISLFNDLKLIDHF